MNKSYLRILGSLLAFSLLVVIGCKKDDPEPSGTADAIASFQFAISTDNFLEVSFSNFSQNATSYTWDFGDNMTSTEESPTHTYAEAGEYTVTLTATGTTESIKTESFTLNDPNSQLALLAGATSKTWILSREGIALGIGPAAGDNAWWSFGGVTPLGERPCVLDDTYTFNRDGSWEFNSGGTIFIDSDANGGWLAVGDPESCHDETEAGLFTSRDGDDLSAYANGGNYTYEYDPASGGLTLLGEGAYIGLPQKGNVVDDNFIPVSTKSYTVFNIAAGSVADTLNLAMLRPDNSAWNFYLLSYHNPADIPPLPSAMPTAGFTVVKDGFNVEFTNTSKNATSYMWDFGDGMSSPDESPTHTYTSEGEFTVTLTAMDDMGGSDMKSEIVAISSATFTAAALSNATGKVWKLDGANSYFVGPTPGSNEWWPGVDVPADRPCIFDDEFVFTDGGMFSFDSKGAVWSEAYMGGADACVDDGDIPAPYNVLGSGMHEFSATDTQITVTGSGAYFGFSKPFNGGELDGMLAPVSEITYEVIDYAKTGNTERLTIAIDYSAGSVGEAFWTMRLISE